jgi:hypothetical protein
MSQEKSSPSGKLHEALGALTRRCRRHCVERSYSSNIPGYRTVVSRGSFLSFFVPRFPGLALGAGWAFIDKHSGALAMLIANRIPNLSL